MSDDDGLLNLSADEYRATLREIDGRTAGMLPKDHCPAKETKRDFSLQRKRTYPDNRSRIAQTALAGSNRCRPLEPVYASLLPNQPDEPTPPMSFSHRAPNRPKRRQGTTSGGEKADS